MIAALPSEFAPSPEDAEFAVVTLGFFFVMLQELKNTKCIYIHMPGLWSSIFPTGELHRGRQLPLSMPGTVFRGCEQVMFQDH